MNNTEHSILSASAVSPRSRGSSHATSEYAPGAAREVESSVSRPALFLAWSNLRQLSGSQTSRDASAAETWIATPLPVRVPSRRRDRGIWLLRNSFMRCAGWSRINAESAALLMICQVSFRPMYTAAKRVLDVAGSLLLLLLLLPLFALIAALVRIDSPGPAIFCQRRIGKDGGEFLLWKFRSMRVDAPKYAPSPASTLDPRLTRIGRLIRRISVDELPQLINVLRGEMSLVGPRPEMPFIVDSYSSLERKRLAVKPGITGLWQVSPARAFPIHENLQYDLHYIHHQSLLLDGAILLRTIAAVIYGIGAV